MVWLVSEDSEEERRGAELILPLLKGLRRVGGWGGGVLGVQ